MARSLDEQAALAAQLDFDELYRRIGAVAKVVQDDPDNAVGTVASVDAVLRETRGEETDLLGLGHKIAEKANEQARKLVCGAGDDYKDEREAFQKALGQGVEALSKTIAGFLVASGVGIPAAALAWVAGVVAKVIINTGGDVLCDAWKAPAPAPAKA